ncbi:MAG: hypothetical protein ABIQ15_10900 [Nocardioides sp.]
MIDDLLAPDSLRSFDVPGDPAACRDSAGRLRHLGHGLEEVAGFLARQGRVSPALAGLAATAYRRRCRHLGEEAADLSRRTVLLSRGLDDLADDLARAQDLMGHAARLASDHGLVLGGLLVPPSGPPSWAEGGDPAAWAAWSQARSRIRRARTLELTAQQAWSHLLRRHLTEPAGTDLPAGPPRREPVDADGRDTDRPGDPERGRATRLDPVTCGLTPGPVEFCGTPEPLTPSRPPGPQAGVDLPGVLGRRSGAGVDDRATH